MARRYPQALLDAIKVATFNSGNANRRLPNLLAWLEVAVVPDVVCL